MKKLLLVMSVFSMSMTPVQVPVVEIQPYEGMNEQYVQVVLNNLLKVYPKVVVNKSIKLPKSGCVGGRYRSDTLMKYLNKIVKPGNKIVGLTEKDITCRDPRSTDWGIFGYGDMPGTTCVASPYRLNKNNKSIQLYKTVVHELGHNFGLDHCPTPGCLMADAKGKNTIDKENGFCTKCKKYLNSKSWII